MNMFTDPTIGPVLTVIFIICCLAGAVFVILENWSKITIQKAIQKPNVRYESYMVLEDGTILYPVAIVDHIDKKV
jgi:hypothetical protein